MKILICGGGRVGVAIAQYLSCSDISVTMIDQDAKLVGQISNLLDVRAICGFASHPEVLEKAGAAHSDILIAVTHSDEINIVTCEVAHALFNVPTKIARIRSETYIRPQWDSLFREGKISLDAIITPEVEIARFVAKSFTYPGVSSAVEFFGGALVILCFLCTPHTSVVNTSVDHVAHLYPNFQGRVVAIKRSETFFLPQGKEKILLGDHIYVAVPCAEARPTCEFFYSGTRRLQRVLICGGGNVGLSLAQEIKNRSPEIHLCLIEQDQNRAQFLAHRLPDVEILKGDAMSRDLLDEIAPQTTDLSISVTEEDKSNILSALLFKNRGASRAFSLINDRTYSPLVTSLGVDSVIDPRATTVARILGYVRRHWIISAYPLKEGECEFLEVKVPKESFLIGKKFSALESEENLLLCAVMREGEVLPLERNKDILFQASDHLSLVAHSTVIPKLEKLFS